MTIESAADRISPEVLLAHEDWVRRLARRLLRNESDVDDVVQDTWMAAYQKKASDIHNLPKWLASVVGNLSRRSLRLRWSEALEGEEPSASVPSADEVLQFEAQRRRIVELTLQLDRPFRDIIILRIYEDLSHAECAQRLGIPVATARTRYHRALHHLRDKCEREELNGVSLAAFLPLLAGLPKGTAAPSGASAVVVTTAAVVLLAGSLALGALWNPRTPRPARAVEVGKLTAAATDSDLHSPPAAERVEGERLPATSLPELLIDSPTAVVAPQSAVRVSGVVEFGESRAGGSPMVEPADIVAIVYRGLQADPRREIERIEFRSSPRGAFHFELPSDDAALRSIQFASARADSVIEPYPQEPVVVVAGEGPISDLVLRYFPYDASLTGRVVDSQGLPAAGADVRCRSASATADADGAFRLPASSAWVLPSVVATFGAQRVSRDSLELTAGDALGVELQLPPGTEGRGRVVDEAGQPLAGAVVRDRKGGGSTSTDERGLFELSFVPAGRQPTLVVEAVGKVVGFSGPDWPPSIHEPIVLREGTSVRGRVETSSGASAAGARVRVGLAPGKRVQVTYTDDEGRFALAQDLTAGEWTIVVDRPGYAAQLEKFRVGQDDPELDLRYTLRKGLHYLGQVDMRPTPSQAFHVDVTWQGWSLRIRRRRGARGLFRIDDLPSAELRVIAADGLHKPASRSIGPEALGLAAPDRPMFLGQGATVVGVVRDPAGDRLAGVKVEIQRGPLPGAELGNHGLFSDVTEADGSYEIVGVVPAEVHVVAHHPDFKSHAVGPLRLTDSELEVVDVDFPSAGDF